MTSRLNSFFSRTIELPILARGSERGQLYRWMAGMLRRGYPLPRILEALAGVSRRHRIWFLALAQQAREGIPLSQAMKKGWGYAPPIVRELVETGEKRNVLAQALTLACELIDPERPSDQKADLKTPSIYFGAVLAITLMTVSVLLIYVVPVFAKMFVDAGGALPLPTQVIISFSTWITKEYGALYLLFGAAILVIGLWLALKWDRADQLLERLPWLGRVFRYSRWWKIAYGMGTLMQEGVPLDEALATLGKGLRMR
jgi:type IV pilus assembly protein PilC